MKQPQEQILFPWWTCKNCQFSNQSERRDEDDPPRCEECGAKNPNFKYQKKKKTGVNT